jgi:hypothetical protein
MFQCMRNYLMYIFDELRMNRMLLLSSILVGSNSSKVNNVRVFININHESKVDIDVQE